MSVSRFGVSLEEELLNALDDYVKDNQFANRSQAIRHLIEKYLAEEKWKCDNIVAGAVTLVYAYQKKEIQAKITEIYHQYKNEILSTQCFLLNEINCLEIIAVKGPSRLLTKISEKLISIKGIQHGKLVMSKA
ncbi:MAG: nickel-responsive transcriptional regulator NikR [Prolixibacteraceae bacterium]|nr:nickel-responsive transcriptional regulator NikR [Prolixibacteraceae bacterium]MBN2772955.1 nickel-responsive transcriptional regulator NikR [Prolixibacteraceae bacterium]